MTAPICGSTSGRSVCRRALGHAGRHGDGRSSWAERARYVAALPLVLFLLVASLGCGTVLDGAIRTANVAGDVAEAAHSALAEVYEAEQVEAAELSDLAVARAVVADIRARFRPAWRAYRVLRASWVAAAAIIRAAQVDGTLTAKALALVVELVAQQAALADAMGALGLGAIPERSSDPVGITRGAP